MQRGDPAPVELTEQLQRDDALARAGSSGDDDDLLAVGAHGPVDRVEHQSVRDLLLVEEHELLTFAYLLGRHGHQLLRRDGGAREQFVRGRGTGVPVAQPRTEVRQEGAAAVLGEQQAAVVPLGLPQEGHLLFRGVVQIRESLHTVPVFGQRPVEVHQVVAVAAHLFDRVEDRVGVRVDVAECGVVLVGQGPAPLLQLDHDVGRLPGGGCTPASTASARLLFSGSAY